MKYYLLILLIVFVGCKETLDDKWDNASDSFNFYTDKFICYRKCNEPDSAKWADKKVDSFYTLEKELYKEMYPNGNPYDKEQEEKPKCNCQ